MSGFDTFGDPIPEPTTGGLTNFWYTGDPESGLGWLDNDHRDKKFLISSGPFSFADGDTQEVALAIVVGQGETGIESVRIMKQNASIAQRAYELGLGPPPAPVAPEADFSATREAILLKWDRSAESYSAVDPINIDSVGNATEYTFQGYNVYQLDTPILTENTRKTKIASFDLIDGVVEIRDDVFVPEFGQIVNLVVQDAQDTGLQRYLRLTEDHLNGREPLSLNKKYFYAVSAYGYNALGIPRTLESPLKIITARTQSLPLGTDLSTTSGFGDTLAVAHLSGASSGGVVPIVLEPAALTGHDYEVRFRKSSSGADSGQTVYDIVDITSSETKAQAFLNQDDALGAQDYPLVDGVLVKVTGPPFAFAGFQVVANAAGALHPPEAGAFGFRNFPTIDNNGDGAPDNPWETQPQQVTGSGAWAIHTGDNGGTSGGGTRGTYDAFIDRVTNGSTRWGEIIPFDYELRFTAAGGRAYEPGLAAGPYMMDVPFELWNIGMATPDDPNDDFRFCPNILDADGDGTFNLSQWGPGDGSGPVGPGGPEHSGSGADNDPFTDWIYWYTPDDRSPGQSGYDAWLAAADADPLSVASGAFWPVLCTDNNMRRMVLINWNGGEQPPFNQALPEPGTIFRITTTKPNTVADVFSYATLAPITDNLTLARQQAMALVNVYPNPMHRNIVDLDNPFEQYVTFTHLPENNATIRIFTIYGDLVRKIEHANSTPFEEWDLLNEAGRSVATGVYIVHIDMGEIGVKVLKLAVM